MSNTSFDKIIDKVFDGFKKVTPALVAVAIISGLILFLPISMLEKMELSNLPKGVTSIVGLVFLFSCALIATIIGSSVFQMARKKIKHARMLKNLKNKFLKLSLSQKKIIVKLLKSSSRSIVLDGTSGNTIYLKENHFIFKPEQILDMFEVCGNEYTYAPQPWLIDLSEKEPDLFDFDDKKKSN